MDCRDAVGLTDEDHAVIKRCVARQPVLYMRGQHEGYYAHSDVADLIDMIGRLSAPVPTGEGVFTPITVRAESMPKPAQGEGVEALREKVAAMAWRFRGNDRLGGPWYEGAKPTDSPAMRDVFAFAERILAALTTGKGGEG